MAEPSRWSFHNPVRIIFGPGCVRELPDVVSGRVLIVTTTGARQRGLVERILDMLDGDPIVHDGVQSNPTVADTSAAIQQHRGETIDWVVAIGGGSAIDVGKAFSLCMSTPAASVESLLDPAHAWQNAVPIPMVAIPTTAGTGSEVTPFATLWDDVAHQKRSLAAARLHPAVAIVDPELSRDLPWSTTLSTGLDAFSQCFEAVVSRSALPITTVLAERGIGLAPDALRTLRSAPGALEARSAAAEAALLSGLAISQTRTGLAHSMSYPVTAHLSVPHGLACALFLPAVIAFNAETDDGRLARLARKQSLSRASEVAPGVVAFYEELGVAAEIHRYLPHVSAIEPYIQEMLTPGRADNNLRPVTHADLPRLLAMTDEWLSA